jgi:hypothetical protein
MPRALALALVLAAARITTAQTPNAGGQLGTVRFETSCAPRTHATFLRGVALLHSFGFGDATRTFNEVLAADPTCLIAYWGLGVSAWGNPFAAGVKPDAQLQRGLDAVNRGRALETGTERERSYLEAVGHLYDNYQSADQRTRVTAYRDALASLAAKYPGDDEASIFHALALAFSADPNDKTYESQKEAGDILNRLAEKLPNHPGIAHYLIHTYDVPALASSGLAAANRYAAIAPASSHALHMPSHTYTRVGQWQQSIGANVKSAKAAAAEGSVGEALHASDYLTYAYLQRCEDDEARRVLEGMPALAARFDPNVVGTGAPPAAAYFAIAAIPARYALERDDWPGAVKLDVHQSAFPFADAVTWFARGLGAARSGDTVTSADAVRQLERLRDALASRREAYWTQQVEIQRRGVNAWLTWARGWHAEALAELRATADLEAGTEKNAITPGPIVPARELLGEMLLANGQAADAVRELEATLKVEPGRLRTIAIAARAAQTAGDSASVRRYRALIPAQCAGARAVR